MLHIFLIIVCFKLVAITMNNMRRFIMKKIALIILGFFISVSNLSASVLNPEILSPENISYISSGKNIVIVGKNFGGSPNVVLFDNFESGILDQKVALSSPIVGEWSSYGTVAPTIANTAHSGSNSMEIFVDSNNTSERMQKQIKKIFDKPITEIYFSYWVKIPSGTFFPASTTLNTLSKISCWKFSWLYDGEKGYMGDDDICFPTYIGSKFAVQGNDKSFYTGPTISWSTEVILPSDWWSFENWMRISGWFKGFGDNLKEINSEPTFTSKMYVEFITEGVAYYSKFYDNVRLFDGDDNSIDNNVSQWTQINFPGWIKDGYSDPNVTMANCRPVYDDIYIATNSNSLSRVEIGDNADFYSCKHREIQIPVDWSNVGNPTQSIKVLINQGSFLKGKTYYIFVVNNVGLVSKGHPVIFQ